MSTLEIYRKQAKQLVRWHRNGNHSIGGRIRRLPRYEALTDREVLALPFPLHEAQEIIALEAGYENWAALKAAAGGVELSAAAPVPPRLVRAIPVLFVSDVDASAAFYRDTLGFSIDFVHGEPPFYGSVSRDGACLHLKFVHQPVLTVAPDDRDAFITAFVEVENVKTLFAEYVAAGVTFTQRLQTEAWGGRDFIVRDPDGNTICFSSAA
jgi:catechol 2,3-dioxygenase-like lactoylglutathione lyase family enzyme